MKSFLVMQTVVDSVYDTIAISKHNHGRNLKSKSMCATIKEKW